MELQAYFFPFAFVYSVIIGYVSWKKSSNHQFYSDSWLGLPLGIFIWGDGLMLAPFWTLMSVLLAVYKDLSLLKILLLFWTIRSFYEVVYWILHQFSNKEYKAPLFRGVTWLSSHDSAILYQLLNMCIGLLALIGLLYSS